MKYVDHTSDSCILSESNHALALIVGQFFIVQQSYVLIEDGVEHGHVRLLGLDRVREEAVGLVGYQVIYGHLFDPKNDRGAAYVLLDRGTSSQVTVCRVGPPIAGLHDDLDTGPDQPSDVRWRQGRSTLPYRLILTTNRYHLSTQARLEKREFLKIIIFCLILGALGGNHRRSSTKKCEDNLD